jgi:hypothetical protein
LELFRFRGFIIITLIPIPILIRLGLGTSPVLEFMASYGFLNNGFDFMITVNEGASSESLGKDRGGNDDEDVLGTEGQ